MTVNAEFRSIAQRLYAVAMAVSNAKDVPEEIRTEAKAAISDYDVHLRSWAELYDDSDEEQDEGDDDGQDGDTGPSSR